MSGPAGGEPNGGPSRLAPGELTGLLRQLAATPGADPAELELQPGDVIGHFLVERCIGRGGFGQVYQAKDLELSRSVALKVIGGGGRGGAEPAEWTRREGEAVARLKHPAVVTLYQAGRSEGRTWLVYELLEGRTLEALLREDLPPRAEARRVLGEVAAALAHAHAHGVVHRDLKPSNVFLEASGAVKVLDFGLAQVVGAAGLAAGSPPYAAPEQWRGEAVDARADVYAWGVLAHALLGGALPGTRPRRVVLTPRGALARLANEARAEAVAARPADGAALVERLAALDRGARRARVAWLAFAVLAAVLAITLRPPAPAVPPGPFKLAVSDADNRSGDPALDGLGALMATQLEGSPRLAVLGRSRLAAVLRASGREAGERIDEEATALAAHLAGAAAFLVPTAARSGSGYALQVEARVPDSRKVLFRVEEAAERGEGLLGAIDRLVRQVRDRLHDREPEVRTAADEQARVVTTSLEAYRHYFEGLRCLEQPSQGGSSWVFPDCQMHFKRALQIDPEFPQANLEVARQAFWFGAPRSELRAQVDRAAAHLERVPPRERPLLLAWKAWLDGDEAGALATLAAAETTFRDDARVVLARGDLLYRAGRFDEAIGPLTRAWRLDPGLEWALDSVVWCQGVLDRTEALRALIGELSRLPPSPGNLHAELQARGWMGEHAAALALARRAATGGGQAAREDLVEALVAAGAFDEAERLVRSMAPEPFGGRNLLAHLLVLQGRLREAGPLIDPPLPADATALDRYYQAARRKTPLALARDAAGVRRLLDRTRVEAPELAAKMAPELAYAGDLDGALAYREALATFPSARDLLDALVTWRRAGAAAALPLLRRLVRGEPRVVTSTSVPPEMPAWYLVEAALEAEGPEAALAALGRFRRFYVPVGFGRVWLLPRALVLEARLLDQVGRPGEAGEALARFESLWRRADPDLPLLAEARALRRRLGSRANPGTEAPAARGR